MLQISVTIWVTIVTAHNKVTALTVQLQSWYHLNQIGVAVNITASR